MISPFKSKYEGVFDSTYVPNYALGAPTSPQTANQIAEATSRLNAGVLGVDLALIDERLFEQMPKQHFKEIDRMMKLTGAKATIHGPIVDLAGFSSGEGGSRWDDDNRKLTEKKIDYYMDMAHEADSKGNTPINFHINTGLPGEHWEKINEKEYSQYKSEAEKLKEKNPELASRTFRETYNSETNKNEYEIKRMMLAVDQETGQLAPLKLELKQYPGGPKLWTPDERLHSQNQTQWDQEKLKIFQLQQQKNEIEDRKVRVLNELNPLEYGHQKGVLSRDENIKREQLMKNAQLWDDHIKELDQHIYTGLNEVYNDLKYIDKNEKKELKKQGFDIDYNIKNMSENYKEIDKEVKKMSGEGQKRIINFIKNINLNKEDAQELYKEKARELENQIDVMRDQQYRELQGNLNRLPAPQKFIRANDLAKEKTVETVSNVLFESWKKYKDNTPLMLLENYLPEGLIGSAKDLGETVEESRKKFAEKLVNEKGIDKEDAKKTAEKLIGVTWDVGHINFLRKQGYSEKDVIAETKKIAPYVKQVHITDNFGFNDAHLPPGMGNAPIKEELAEIAKEMKKKGLEYRKGHVIVEAGSFVGQFKENPHPYTLEYFNSGLYQNQVSPYWKNIWETEAPYGLGYGQILPGKHFEMYGAGFSNLPVDLGGPISQDRSRFSGAPMD